MITRSVPALAGTTLAALALALTGCATTSADEVAPETTEVAPPEQQPSGPLIGEIAALSGDIVQVQDGESQTAVTVSDTTAISATTTSSIDAIDAGSCVLVIGGTESAATSVAVSEAIDGECQAASFGGGFGGGMPPGGDAPAEGETPTDLPSPPAGAEGMAEGGFGDFTSGIVTAVGTASIAVDATDVEGTVSSVELLLDSSSTITTTAASDASALAVGLCVSVQGDDDGTGTVAATSITVSEPADEGCLAGFGGRGPGAAPGSPSGDEVDQ